mgnify:CR=1 FL=1
MRIFNESKTIELTKEQCDFARGYLKEEKIEINGNEEIILVYTPYSQKELYLKEKQELQYWFATEYREMFEKCTRRIVLGKTLRDGTDPNLKLQELYSKAEINAERINQLESLINIL